MRAQVLRLVSLPLWHALSRGRLQLELHDQPQLAKHWKHLAKKEAKAAAAAQEGHVPVQQRPEATFLPGESTGTGAGTGTGTGSGTSAPSSLCSRGSQAWGLGGLLDACLPVSTSHLSRPLRHAAATG